MTLISSKISVVIPTFNSWDTLKESIKSVQNQSVSVREIIVINNGSLDSTAKNVKKFFPKIKLINFKKNTGVTGGRNGGIKTVDKHCDYILFFDHDMVADKKMIEELLKVAKKSSDIGIVTPKIYYFDNKKIIWAAGTGIDLWTGKILFRFGEDKGQYEMDKEVQVAPAAFLVKKEVIKKLKQFDNRYFATYEDTDFCFRAKRAGFKTYYSAKALAYHKIPLESSDRVLSRSYWIGRNRVIFMKDFGKSFFIFMFFIPLFSLYYLLIALLNKRPSAWFNFIRGTWDGLILK